MPLHKIVLRISREHHKHRAGRLVSVSIPKNVGAVQEMIMKHREIGLKYKADRMLHMNLHFMLSILI